MDGVSFWGQVGRLFFALVDLNVWEWVCAKRYIANKFKAINSWGVVFVAAMPYAWEGRVNVFINRCAVFIYDGSTKYWVNVSIDSGKS